ncbi:hypothetical protein VIGAN_09126800 [Vigna angularis var. angularis]|uniref:Uncharacterized protein n=1 Tax=Vigna angularis var. angularis TaxID=157739 RepID=A0A0S3SY67_PHAAN|nr:hypothetical protein VIGAN_09126800 [Vigna angularis var. angularis]
MRWILQIGFYSINLAATSSPSSEILTSIKHQTLAAKPSTIVVVNSYDATNIMHCRHHETSSLDHHPRYKAATRHHPSRSHGSCHDHHLPPPSNPRAPPPIFTITKPAYQKSPHQAKP